MSDIAIGADDHHEHEHEHPSWLAHHFDDAEQQFDAGKLGMWLFLVTEVLFFSGMFCAYAMYRHLHPEIYEFASEFLNEKLGAINTGVLLFSSLTMAWAVRAAQLSQHRLLISMLAMTLSCAAIFLGVKAVEYSHKWSNGLLPGKHYITQGVLPPSHDQYWLYVLCTPAAICLVVFFIWYFMTLVKSDSFQRQVSGPLLVAALCFFGGVGLGVYLESLEAHAHVSHATAGSEHGHADSSHGDHAHSYAAEIATIAPATPAGTANAMTAVVAVSPVIATPGSIQAHPDQVLIDAKRAGIDRPEVNQKSKAGLFFAIYYMMTGVHAVHILGGMVVITWLIVKAARKEFHSKYFGPVDNVGLYWHLVDFIWIYLFPLLYLIK
ncbi:MAG: cytochrome c oxidase subunit 3 [Pirellulaceae bacterium]|nr:cytochrome c oxidase subunit 3 [Pirellulaceae bacterium]